ncbi:MAG: alpha/beta hydrolase [Burkholderiales bacterium]
MQPKFEVDIEEVEYLRHGGKGYLARVFKPRGKGPFPLVLDIHGGAWVDGHRAQNDSINRPVAEGGVVVASIDFRCPPEATYPASVADVNYGVRWLKSQAARFNSRPDMVGVMGTSSGGHLAVLAAMKPTDPRYCAVPLPAAPQVDAKVSYVVTLWPVICPLGRFKDHTSRPVDDPAYQGRGGAAQRQLQYWLTEDAMAEGSPNLALQRGDKVALPNILYLQSPLDIMHPRKNLDEFVAGYRKAGGNVQLELYEGKPYDLVRSQPDSETAKAQVRKMVEFIHKHAASSPVAA